MLLLTNQQANVLKQFNSNGTFSFAGSRAQCSDRAVALPTWPSGKLPAMAVAATAAAVAAAHAPARGGCRASVAGSAR
jgi:hypothetical protein